MTDAASAATRGLRVREFSDELAPAFRDINAEWIGAMYHLEEGDRAVLEAPRTAILDPGGAILFVEADDLGVVGTCALRRTGPDAYELTKMGVRETARGRGVGSVLLQAAIAKARELGARTLHLLSNRKSATAIGMYERAGFVHCAETMAQHGALYARCDVAMRYTGPLP